VLATGAATGCGASSMRLRRAAYSASDRARKKAPMAMEIRLKKDGKG
jgi:hypothetical protein